MTEYPNVFDILDGKYDNAMFNGATKRFLIISGGGRGRSVIPESSILFLEEFEDGEGNTITVVHLTSGRDIEICKDIAEVAKVAYGHEFFPEEDEPSE